MSDIVHSHAEHVEKTRRVLRGNKMSCKHRSMVGSMANPPTSPDCNPEEGIYSEADSNAVDHSYLPPKVFSLTWDDDVSHIMHMPCSAYFRHHICHLLSLDMFCNATYLVSISYMGIMQSHVF